MQSTHARSDQDSPRHRPNGCLSHVRVLDLSRVFAGPWATQILADLGAEVIKVEKPGVGDDARRLGDASAPSADGRERQSSFYRSTNRNKRSITVDLSSADGQSIVRDLAAACDVLVENYKVGTLERYGLDYGTLSKVNPRLVYCSITGFGQTGPYRNRAGYDLIFQAMSGLMSVTGDPDEQGGSPQRVGIVISDLTSGMYAATAILAALSHRDQSSGTGQHIDLGLLDCQVAAMSHVLTSHFISGRIPARFGTAAPSGTPSQMYPCADGSVVVVVGNEAQFERFCAIVGIADAATDERFKSNAARLAHRDELNALIVDALKRRPRDELLSAFETAGVPAAAVLDLAEVVRDEHVHARRMIVEAREPHDRLVASPIRMSATPVTSYAPAPRLGEHTDDVLRDMLGLADDAILDLRRRGVV